MKTGVLPNKKAELFMVMQFCSNMKRHQFTTIEEVQEAHRLLRAAVPVASRRDGFYKVELYQAPSFYLEVYRHAHFNVIIRISRFRDTAYLEPYLEQVSLDGLLSSL